MTTVCPLDRIDREGGVAALVDGRPVAIFRTHDDEVYALSNIDPFSGASVLSRGIVGTRTVATPDGMQQVPFVASPLLKQAFDLRSGRCLDDASVAVTSYAVSVVAGVVQVGEPRQL